MKNEVWKISSHSSHYTFIVMLEAMKGVEPLSFGLQDRRSVYPVELHRRRSFEFRVPGFELFLGTDNSEPGTRNPKPKPETRNSKLETL